MLVPVPRREAVPGLAFFFFFFGCEDSLPLTSERFGEPPRLMLLASATRCVASRCLLGRLLGVLLPLVEEPEGGWDGLTVFSPISDFWSSSLDFPLSECSDSV